MQNIVLYICIKIKSQSKVYKMEKLIKEYKMISSTLFSMNTIDDDNKEVANQYSARLKEIRGILSMSHIEIINL